MVTQMSRISEVSFACRVAMFMERMMMVSVLPYWLPCRVSWPSSSRFTQASGRPSVTA